MPSAGTAERGLSFGSSPHRASVSRTPGKSVHSAVMLGETCIMVNCDWATSAALRACANATSLAAEKSDGCRMLSMIGTLSSWGAVIVVYRLPRLSELLLGCDDNV